MEKSVQSWLGLSNHLVRSREHIRRNRQADLLGCFQIDDEPNFFGCSIGKRGRRSSASSPAPPRRSESPGSLDDDRQSGIAQCVAFGPVRTLVELDLLAHPISRTRDVFRHWLSPRYGYLACRPIVFKRTRPRR